MALPVITLGLGSIGKNPVSKAINTITRVISDPIGALGIGKGASDVTYKRRQAAQIRNVRMAQAGDKTALAMLAAIGGVKGLPFEVSETRYTWRGATLPKGWSSKTAGWGDAYKNIVQRARAWYDSLKEGGVWPDGNGSAPDASPGSPPTETSPEESAPPVSKPKPKPKPKPTPTPGPKPCPPGSERNPDTGRCRKVPAAGPGYGIVAKPGGGPKPCPEGSERNPDTGRCRKLRTKAAVGRGLTKKQSQLIRRAETAAGRVVATGAKGAIKAVAAGVASAGGWGAVASSAALVLAAAAAGWFIGQDIQRSLSGEAAQLRIEAANRDRRYAVAAMRESLGRQPTLAEQSAITEAYKKRLQLIRAGGFA